MLALRITTAQIPVIEELASEWTPTRFCRPLAEGPLVPCVAGASLSARACGDFGCCFRTHGAPACYEPNGGSRGSANQSVFGADPWADYLAVGAWGLFSETGREQFFKTIGIGTSSGAETA